MSDEKTRAPASRVGTRMIALQRGAPVVNDSVARTASSAGPAVIPDVTGELLAAIRETPASRLQPEEPIAKGGMGSVFRVYDRGLARRVAKKTIHTMLRDQEGMVRMFLREARINALLDHPNIVPVYDIGEDAQGDLYFTMKLVSGQPLKQVIGTLPAPIEKQIDYGSLFNLLDVVVKVCDALGFAHDKGVLHCDVKPDNVMLGAFGQVYLMDWGISRVMGSRESSASIPPRAAGDEASAGEPDPAETDESIIGTVSYMSPEQARGNRALLDARADVFLLGGLLYEILARRPPYAAESFEETLKLASLGAWPPLKSVCKEGTVPTELDRIVQKAMARNRSDRYASALDLKEDIVRFSRGGTEFPQTTFPRGTYVVKEGEEGDSAYIIVSGKCDVLKAIDGNVSVMQRLGPGQVFGEMAILTAGKRTATVLATEDTTVHVVTREVFEQELSAMKPWMRSVLELLASRLRDLYTQKRVTHVGMPNPVRIARQIYMHLLAWGTAEPDGSVSMPWTKACAAVEAQLGVPVAMAILVVTARFPSIHVDFAQDRLRMRDIPGLREALAKTA